MRDLLELIGMAILGTCAAVFGIAVWLALMVIVTAPFWSIGLVALWFVGII